MAKSSFWMTDKGFIALLFIGAVTYFLFMEHRQHVYQWLPYVIIGLCPLMHIFMHRNHGSHSEPGENHKHSGTGT
ncbi:MAG: DUF2933 domain-containing protein [Pseudohongiellaceae bacterium]